MMALKNDSKEEVICDKWVWIDLEMTGLDDATCAILQVAMVITDSSLNVLAEIDVPIWQPESILSTMIPIVKSMHMKNKLIDRVRLSEYSIAQAEEMLMDILCKHVSYKRGVLAGNSIYVDRRFLKRYMPSVESFLNYRQIDVSSIKILAMSWYGQNKFPQKKPSTHTALEDIKESIAELKTYRQKFFIDPASVD